MWRAAFILIFVSGAAEAGIISSSIQYLRQYRLGVELSSYDSTLQLDYVDVRSNHYSCKASAEHGGQTVCRANIGDDSNRGMDYGLFLQQAFKRKGLLHYDFDLGFSLRYLAGDNAKDSERGTFDHPFSSVAYRYLFTELRPYIQLGITPKSLLPDLIVSLGPVAHYAYGALEIDDEEFQTEGAGVLGRSSVWEFMNYFEVELVIARFGQDGALSLFTASVQNRPTVGTGALFPEQVGATKILGGSFRRHTSGIKWVIGQL